MALTGRAALVAFLAVLVVYVAPAGGVTVAVVAGVLACAVALDLVLAGSPRTVVLRRDEVAPTRLGEATTTTVLLDNVGARRVRGSVRDLWPPSAQAHPRTVPLDLPAGERRRVTVGLTPQRRGEVSTAGLTVRALGPLGLAARQRTRGCPGTLRVLPAFTSRRLLPEKLTRLRQLEGEVVAPLRGQGTEFDALREYVVGDDPRSIDWRATARRADVVVRTWRPERDRQILLVLDTGRTSAVRVGGAPRLETTLDAALLLTALAHHAGDRVALLAHDVVPRVMLDTGRDSGSLAAVVAATAGLMPALVETDMAAVVGQVLRRMRRRALVVLLTAMDPAVVGQGLLPALGPLVSRHTVVVASVADPDVEALSRRRTDAEAVYAAAAATAVQEERAAVAATLRRRGVEVVERGPEEFASAVADRYLDLKAAGRL